MTRLVNAAGRAKILLVDGTADIATVSDGRFGPDIQDLYEQWDAFAGWLATASPTADGPLPSDDELDSPSPRPRQVVGVGINYRSSLDNGKFELPRSPGVFSKFATSIGGPHEQVALTGERVITEVELAVVIGRRAENVAAADALAYVAGVATAQDLIDGESVIGLMTVGGGRGPSYMDLGKSRPGFAPVGPELVTLDEAGDLDDLRIELIVDGEHWQDASTKELLFDVPAIIERVSHQIPLLPGDVVLTGSPYWLDGFAGRPLTEGSTVVARVGSLGEQRKTVSPAVAERGVA